MSHELPTDSDVDLHDPAQQIELRSHHLSVLGAISVGGAVGALARYGLGVAFPSAPSAFPWATFAINVSGCLLIGIVMVLVTDVWPEQRLTRPFLGVGILGGFTTFSTYVVDIQRLFSHHVPVTALAYLVVTAVSALIAAWAGLAIGRAVLT